MRLCVEARPSPHDAGDPSIHSGGVRWRCVPRVDVDRLGRWPWQTRVDPGQRPALGCRLPTKPATKKSDMAEDTEDRPVLDTLAMMTAASHRHRLPPVRGARTVNYETR